jgi:glycosyltransferase involved in cell wall biosynthesis
MARISVIIPAFNRAHLIGETIESVLAQTFREFELIVVDDGSTDRTAEVVRSYDGPIRYRFQPNQGRSSARNAGYAASRGEYICFLDSDDVLAPQMLERLAGMLDARDELGFVYCDSQFVDQSGAPLPKPAQFIRRSGGAFFNICFASILFRLRRCWRAGAAWRRRVCSSRRSSLRKTWTGCCA